MSAYTRWLRNRKQRENGLANAENTSESSAYQRFVEHVERRQSGLQGIDTSDLLPIRSTIQPIQSGIDTHPIKDTVGTNNKDWLYDLASFTLPLTAVTSFQNGTFNADQYLTDKGRIDDYIASRAVERRQGYLEQGARMLGVADPNSANYDPEFKNKSGYVSTESKNFWDSTLSQYNMGYDDLTYEYINGANNGMRDRIHSIENSRMGRNNNSAWEFYDNLSDDEIAIYNYYYATDGKDKAEDYLDYIRESVNTRIAADKFSDLEGETAREILFGVEAGFDQFGQGVTNLFNTDDYIAPSTKQILSGMVREDLQDDGFEILGSSVAQIGYDFLNTTANMLPSIGASAVANLVIPGSGAVVGSGLMGASAAGNSYQEAINAGYSKGQARVYSTVIGASEAALQNLIGGIPGLKQGGSAVTKLIDGIDNAAWRAVARIGANAVSEGFEEGLQEVLDPIFRNLILKADEDIDIEEVVYSALLGAFSSLGFGAADVATNNTRYGLSQNEQLVFDRVYNDMIAEAEQSGETLTASDKQQMREQVLYNIEHGYIDPEIIEEALGGETYQRYQDIVAQEDAVYKEYEELRNKQGYSIADMERYSELAATIQDWKKTSSRESLREQLQKNAFNLSQNTRLAESYAEVERRRIHFDADLSDMSDARKAVYQAAIDSGVVDNTNKSHEIVDTLAKLAEDKGLTVEFTDREKAWNEMKSSFSAEEWKTIQNAIDNGLPNNFDAATEYIENLDVDAQTKELLQKFAYEADIVRRSQGRIEGNHIVLNVDSDAWLNSVVGHELGHAIEKAGGYDKLQEMLYEVARSRGEYDSRRASVESRYRNVKDANIDIELTNDLIGDYIFTNREFVQRLSVENRNAFQTIWDELKHIYKLATAGSKEARQLEKAMKMFSDIYRESGKAQHSGVDHSLRIKHTDGSIEELANARAVTQEKSVDYLYQAKSGALKGNTYIPVRSNTPQVLIDTLEQVNEHIDNLSMVMSVDKARAAMGDNQTKTKKHGDNIRKHGLSPEQIVEIINNLDNPTTVIYQTNRSDNQGNSLPNSVAVFVEYNADGNEGVAAVEFENPRNSDSIGTEFGETNYHTVITVFEPDTVRNDMPFDYAEELLLNRNNQELEIVKRQSERSDTWEKHPNTSNELPFSNITITQDVPVVKYSMSDSDGNNITDNLDINLSLSDDIAPTNYGNWHISGSDIKYQGDDIAPPIPNSESAFDAPVAENATTSFDAPIAESAPRSTADAVERKHNATIQNLETELENNRRIRNESLTDFNATIEEQQKKYDSLKNKTTQKANSILRRIERLKRMRDNTDASFEDRINRLSARIEKMSTPEYKRSEQRKAKGEEYTSLIKDLVGDTSKWVDKKNGVFYKTNTLRRNLRDVVRDEKGNRDIEKADAIYEELQGKYNRHEAQLNRESNTIKKPYADMNITKAEDAYIQMLGEFRHNPDSTITEDAINKYYEQHKDNIDTEKVDKIIRDARETYDSLLVRVNEVLREQGMKEIPYRKGYFPHFTEPKQGWLAKLLNWKVQDDSIPTDIAGLTENYNPNRSWQSFNKQRKTDITDYSFKKGMDSYVRGALDWIYHIEDIQKRRAFENYIRYVRSDAGVQERINAVNSMGYDAEEIQDQVDLIYREAKNKLNNFVTDLRAGTNTLANKKSSMDRGMEEMTNRKIYSVLTNINNRVSANNVVGNIASALTNFAPITQSWVQVSPIRSAQAALQTLGNAFRSDGVIDKSDFLTNRLATAENLYKTAWDNISDKASLLMEVIDNFSAQVIWRSKYNDNIANGMSEAESVRNADQFSENVMAGRSRGNMPTIFDSKNPLIKMFTAFQLEVSNQYGYMFKDAPQDMRNEAKSKLVAGYITAFVGAYFANNLYEAITGRRVIFDPINIIIELLRDMGVFGEDDEEEDIGAALGNFADNVIDEIPFIGGLSGGGRMPISSALPYNGLMEMITGTYEDISDRNWENLRNEWSNPLFYLAIPVGGGQLKKTIGGLSMFSDDHPVAGSYTDSGSLRFPVEDTFWNRVQAGLFGQWASESARDYLDNDWAPLNEKYTQQYIDSGVSFEEYHDFRDELSQIADRIEEGTATDDEIINYKFMSSVSSEISELYSQIDEISESDLPSDRMEYQISQLQDQISELNRYAFENYGNVTFEDDYRAGGEYARIGDYVYHLNDNEESENYGKWERLTEEQQTKYEVTYAAGDAYFASDGTNQYRWYTSKDGESSWQKISDDEFKQQNKVTVSLGITADEYWSKPKEYSYAYNNPGWYQVSRACGGYEVYMEYRDALEDIKADKDENGNTINGSRKAKVFEYINNMYADYMTRVILWKSQYTSDDQYNYEIIEYIDGRNDFTYEQKKAFLEQLGFRVDDDGNVTW